jgi:dihydroorotate dehydrogenase electron transfer subunit
VLAPVTEKRTITSDLFVLRLEAPQISSFVKPGQFVNILPKIGVIDPLLRRPFSVYQRDEDWIEIIVQIHGRGTTEIAGTMVGETLDVIGPLGMPWKYDSGDRSTAILLVGGVGVASMPLLTQLFKQTGASFETYYGARNSTLFADEYLANVHYATDDGSKGYPGTIISLLRDHLKQEKYTSPKLFVCGPTPMMRAAAALANEFGIKCEVSLETEMACGVGICQGCPVQTTEAELTASGRKFHLVCTQGPSFEYDRIVF